MQELVGDIDFGWTFHRAIDSCILDRPRPGGRCASLPHLDQVLTAGSVRSVAEGLIELGRRATRTRFAAGT